MPIVAPLLDIQRLSIDFVTEGVVTHAVRNISLQVNRGEILAIVGESGSGKSVTSLAILQLLPSPPAKYSSGKILFAEKEPVDLLTLNQAELRTVRGNKISMIFQEPMTSLNPVMSCGRQVAEALRAHKDISAAEARMRAIEWFEKVKLPHPEKIFDRYPHQLSGGQKQRVMIAMAMCCHPSLLICDEPTTALDVTVQKTILELIRELQQQENMGVIFITHDLGVVADIADRVAIMYKGEIVEQGAKSGIFQNPQHAYTKALIACRPANHPKTHRLPTVADFIGVAEDVRAIKITNPDPVTLQHDQKPAGSLVRAENVVVKFPGKTNLFGKVTSHITAVDDVSFEVFRNETLGLVGESGCGKTTLGRTMLRLVEPTSGRIIFNERDIIKLARPDVAALRRDIQLIFQDPYSSLNPRLTVGAAIGEPILVSGSKPGKTERRKRISELLEMVSLSPSMMNRYPHEFSGGQRQRIVIARALALNPGFLVCDESVSALDVSVQAQVLNLLNDLKRDLGLTMLFISHDLSVVRYMCDRIMVMNRGKIVESGAAEEVYSHPKSEYTKKLIEAIPAI